MEQSELLYLLKCMMRGFSAMFGSETELVLHDLEKREVVYIINGHITGREAGYRMDPSVYETMVDLADEDGFTTGYSSHSTTGTPLRSCHFVVRDTNDRPRAMVCMNQNTSDLEKARDILNSLIGARNIVIPAERDDTNYIQKVTQQVIIDVIQRQKPTVMDTKEAKMEALRKLEQQGVFAVKDAVPAVCRQLSISQATLYNYLREIRSQNALLLGDS